MPRILGTGLVALDLIVEYFDSGRKVSAGGGGTCGNVLSILSRAGWQSSLVGALDNSVWSKILRADLVAAGVATQGLVEADSARPPLIVEHLDRCGEFAGSHWFNFICPLCRSDWSGFPETTDRVVRQAFPAVGGQDVLFVDRLSEVTMDLVRLAKEQGSSIVYEPSVKADRPWISDMLAMADVVKYSDERADALGVSAGDIDAALVIVTAGARGSAWRLGGLDGPWQQQQARPATSVVDTCGAGDWFTAGLLHGLFGESHPAELNFDQVAFAVEGASALAAWSCGYVGARGALYDADEQTLIRRLAPLQRGPRPHRAALPPLHRPTIPDAQCREIASICGI
jgi:fructokinase